MSLASDDAVAATAKHFIGDGGTVWGTSDIPEYEIDRGVTDGNDEVMHDVFLPPYRSAIDAGARIVMASFSSTPAGKVHGDKHLLTDVLKGQLAFTGFVVSDWGGVDEVVPGDYDASVAQAIERRDRHGHGPVRHGGLPRRRCGATWRTGGSNATGWTMPCAGSCA